MNPTVEPAAYPGTIDPQRRAVRTGPLAALLRGRVLAFLPVAVVVGVLAGFAAANVGVTYSSQATLLIDQPRAIAASGDEGVVAKLSRLRYKYAGLVTTTRVAGPAAQATGLSEGAASGRLFATVDPTSLLLAVGSRGSDAASTRRLAVAAADALVGYVRSEQERAGIPARQRLTLSVVVPAGPARQISPTLRREAVIGLLAALVALGVVAGVAALSARRE